MCAALLREAVPWGYIDEATAPLRKEEFIARHSSVDGVRDLLAGVPDENSFVIYYGAGDAVARRAHEADATLTPMWGNSSLVPLSSDGGNGSSTRAGEGGAADVSIADEVLQCVVHSVRVYRSGPTGRRRREDDKGGKKDKGSGALLANAFAHIDLQVIVPAQIPAASPAPVLEEPLNPLARLNRLAARVIEALSNTPRNVPFGLPVDEHEHEDYYEKIKRPMCLETMLLAARKGKYESAAAVTADLALLRENCRTYCAETFPTLVEDAEALYEQGLQLMDNLGLHDDGHGGSSVDNNGHSSSASSEAAGHNGQATAVAVAAAAPPADGTFSKAARKVTVCVPLCASHSPFLIKPPTYTKAVRCKAGYHREGRVLMTIEEGGQRTTFRGAIVGVKPPRPDGYVRRRTAAFDNTNSFLLVTYSSHLTVKLRPFAAVQVHPVGVAACGMGRLESAVRRGVGQGYGRQGSCRGGR